MVDLHLFLGRKLSTGYETEINSYEKDNNEEDAPNDDHPKDEEAASQNNKNDDEMIYSFDDMTPDMVHYGCVPELVLVEEVENVRRMVDAEMAGSYVLSSSSASLMRSASIAWIMPASVSLATRGAAFDGMFVSLAFRFESVSVHAFSTSSATTSRLRTFASSSSEISASALTFRVLASSYVEPSFTPPVLAIHHLSITLLIFCG